MVTHRGKTGDLLRQRRIGRTDSRSSIGGVAAMENRHSSGVAAQPGVQLTPLARPVGWTQF